MEWKDAIMRYVVGRRKLNPVQEAALSTGFLEGKNLVVASPTSSGKTMIAEMAIVKNFLSGGKSVYLSPLKSLAEEKYREFSRFSSLGMKVALSTGDMDSDDSWLSRYDLIITTSEKLDSLIRHGSPFIPSVSLLVVDEIHMLNDPSRGPTLELNIMRMMNRWVVGLSATINNARELASWLNAELVVSDYRPVKLDIGILYNGKLMIGGIERESDEVSLVREAVDMGKQVLVFVSSRRSAESYAEKLSSMLGLSFPESERILTIDPPTRQCERLEKVLRGGVAFHHAGLHPSQKRLVEKWFREGKIKAIVATPTLAMGMNLPAFRVVVRDLKRFGQGFSDFIPAMEVNQMLGRAGRFGMDERGEGIIVAKSEAELRYAMGIGDIEDITSKLSVEPVLRSHILAMVAEGMESEESILSFLSRSFFAHQYGDIDKLSVVVSRIIGKLWKWGMVELDDFRGRIFATPVGRRVARLYLDPYSAYMIMHGIGKGREAALFSITLATEMMPLLRVRRGEEWFVDIPDELLELSIFPERSMKTASFLLDWIDEMPERELSEKYGITPGGIVSKVRIAEWLLYSMEELARLAKRHRDASMLEKLRKMVSHGAKEELLPLLSIRGIGRARARKLFNAGIRNPVMLKKAGVEGISSILGRKTAERIMNGLK